MQPDFSVGSRYDRKNNFTDIKFGANAKILEVELNEMQDIQNEARADIIRESIPSGFTKLGSLDFDYMKTNPNSIKFKEESVAFVNGYKITIPTGTVIPLNAPPTKDFVNAEGKKGTREDLVFLEVWKEEVNYNDIIKSNGNVDGITIDNTIMDNRIGVETSRRIQLKYRLRVVDNTDFSRFPEGLPFKTYGHWLSPAPQGGNTSPIDLLNLWSTNNAYSFRPANSSFYPVSDDIGLYVAGNNMKTALKTVDGYVYAIPMFRVHRRNDGGYSVNNGNGASCIKLLGKIKRSELTSATYGMKQSWGVEEEDYKSINIGDKIMDIENFVEVVNKEPNNKLIVQICGGTWGTSDIEPNRLKYLSCRPDSLFADIIDERDIVDLRHQVSLTGFDYHKLLEDNFTSLLKGELQTKEKTKMLKTYHGIPKTPIDSNTVFYASFDGTVVAEKGGIPVEDQTTMYTFKPSPNGLGLRLNQSGKADSKIALKYRNFSIDNSDFTVDILFKSNSSRDWGIYLGSEKDDAILRLLGVVDGNYQAVIYTLKDGVVSGIYENCCLVPSGINHLRIRYIKNDNKLFYYLNGKLIKELSGEILKYFRYKTTPIGSLWINANDTSIYNISISNMDKGEVFSNLPQDFIDGYATIAPAFNEQRNVYSDALTSEYKKDILKASGEAKRQYTLTQYSKGSWTKGDLIKIKGLGGEIIGGVIDSDTVLATIVEGYDSATCPATIKVDTTKGLSVGDTLKRFGNINGVLILDIEFTVDKIEGNYVTLSWSGTPKSLNSGLNLIESTESSSSPTLKFDKGGTLTSVNGSWKGLGTNEVTFILDTTDGLTNQDLQIEYSLNEVPGQGGISEVLTETLAGEINGKKLVVNPTVHIVDDFKGKIQGSTSGNPSTTKYTYSEELMSPQNFSKELNIDYSKINKKDDICSTVTVNATQDGKGKIPQMLFSFNIVEIVEQKYGKIPELNLAGKVQWCKDNIKTIICNWWGYGSCPDGNKVYLDAFVINGGFWNFNNANEKSKISHTESFSKKLAIGHKYPNNWIDSKGFIHFIVYTDASDGVTPSTIFTDYINISITLKTPGGYDVLAPENPRRDDGQSNILLVRKETKEIQVMFDGLDYNSKVVTYGDCIPNQCLPYKKYDDDHTVVNSSKVFLTTLGTTKGGSIPFAERLFLGRNSDVTGDFRPHMLMGEEIFTDGIYSDSNAKTTCGFDYTNLCEHERNVAKGGVGVRIFNKKTSPNTLETFYELINNDGELILRTISCRNSSEAYVNILYPQNRPLIKE